MALGGCTTSGGDQAASSSSGTAPTTTGAGGTTSASSAAVSTQSAGSTGAVSGAPATTSAGAGGSATTTPSGPLLTADQGRSLAHDAALVGAIQLTQNPTNRLRSQVRQYGECQDYYRQVDAHVLGTWGGQVSPPGATDQSESIHIVVLDAPGMADRLETEFEPCRQRMVSLGILAPSRPPEHGASGPLTWTRVVGAGATPVVTVSVIFGNVVVTRSRAGSTDLPVDPFLGTVATAVNRAARQ